MSASNLPRIFSDRMLKTELAGQAENIVAAMKDWGLGRIDEKDTIHFCGLIHHPTDGAFVFLPREAKTDNPQKDLETASLTMRALVRFGAETSKREFENDGEAGNPGTLSVIKHLADDFRDHGLFFERGRKNTRNSGKPDWGRTIKREVAIPNSDGQPIFSNVRTNRSIKTSDALLAQIQAAVLLEILNTHGWWIPGLTPRKRELISSQLPRIPRSGWVRKLNAILSNLYSTRSIFLVEYLRHYLRETRASVNGSFIFGVSDFHTVWETILRETIVRSASDTRRKWNRELPKPVYFSDAAEGREATKRGMQTDIILENEKSFTIVDAKYYAATNAASAPGWPDIAKQIFYEMALREVVDDGVSPPAKIENIFAFPRVESVGPLQRVEILRQDGTPTTSAFPSIPCCYISVSDALRHYCDRSQGIEINRVKQTGPNQQTALFER
ncbi:hypothetical protein JI58_09380 [Marinosulfonomonas sp. PRT-SC04]|nr:hypothetical protein JI58_09380 [Marinosulfonomonas sp. PRT-SC04]